MENLFEVDRLTMHFPITRGFTQRVVGHVRAVSDVSFRIGRQETLGVVGESGCGKSTTGNCLIRLLKPTSGHILYDAGQPSPVDLAALSDGELRFYRRQAQMIFQDPYSSLDPRMTIRELVGEPLLVNNLARGSEITDRVGAMLRRVGLRAEYMKRYPHAFSGGQRQRISIARALIVEPRFVICDEAVSSLDVSVQAQIVELLRDLQAEFGNTYLFISHDLSVVRHISNRIMVMYLGQIMEMCDSTRAAMEVGAVSYLLKPLDPEILIGTLTKAVDRLSAAGQTQDASPRRSDTVSPGSNESAALADRIYNYIAAHHAESLAISDIKNRFCVSESYINKLLIRYRGKSFVRILTQIRVTEAFRMMQQYPEMPIQDIAYAVGYNDPHYFSRIYKAMTGVAPSQEKKEKTIEVYGYGKR